MKSFLTTTFWTIWVITSLLLIGTLATSVEITNELIRKGLIFISTFGLVEIATIKKPWALTRKLAISTLAFGLFLIVSLVIDWRGDWKTQTILYRNNHLANRTIEFQLQDKGARGFNRRTVDRLKLIPFVSWTGRLREENLKNVDSLTWDKVDIDLNEQGFKGG